MNFQLLFSILIYISGALTINNPNTSPVPKSKKTTKSLKGNLSINQKLPSAAKTNPKGLTPSNSQTNSFAVSTNDTYKPIVNLSLLDPQKEIFILQPFYIKLSIIYKPQVVITLPSKIDGGIRFQVEGSPQKIEEEKLDSGNIRRIYKIKFTALLTDRLLDRKAERINKRMRRHESDLNEAKTKLTKAKLDNKDTSELEETVSKYEARYLKDKKEFEVIQKQYSIKPIPISYKRPDGTMGVVMSHEEDKGPQILISSKLANEPDPKLKEPASEENKKAGGPFWQPFSIYEENKTLKNIVIGILIGLVIFALLLPLGMYIAKRRKQTPPPPPPRPAHEIAFAKLEKLKQVFDSSEIPNMQEFAFELSEIAREYFGNRYNFYSLELTTYELLKKLKTIKMQGIVQSELEEFFDFLDLVKFAKVPFSQGEFQEYNDRLYDFIRKTANYKKQTLETNNNNNEESNNKNQNDDKHTNLTKENSFNSNKKESQEESRKEQSNQQKSLDDFHEELIEKKTNHKKNDNTES